MTDEATIAEHDRRHEVTVILNRKPERILSGDYTTETLKKALRVDASLDLDLVVHGEFHPLRPGEHIEVREGLDFVSHVHHGGSSRA